MPHVYNGDYYRLLNEFYIRSIRRLRNQRPLGQRLRNDKNVIEESGAPPLETDRPSAAVVFGTSENEIPMLCTPAQPMSSVHNGDQPDDCSDDMLHVLHRYNKHKKSIKQKPEERGYQCERPAPYYLVPGKKQKGNQRLLVCSRHPKTAEQKELDKRIAARRFDNPSSQPSAAAGSSGSFNATASPSSMSAPSLSSVNQQMMPTSGFMDLPSQWSSTPNTSSNSAQMRSALATSAGTPNVTNNAAADPQLADLNALRQQYQQQLLQQQQQRLIEAEIAQMVANPWWRQNLGQQLAAPNASGQQQPPLQFQHTPQQMSAPPAQIVPPQQGSSGNAAASNPLTSMLGGMNPQMQS
uniref:Uncharacterized protein n=1 Tax=Steinernema glaseri TaxID=37863 RepID=A0A1I7XW01_9BILA